MTNTRSNGLLARSVVALLGGAVGTLIAGPALAGGVMLYEIGTIDTGLGSAGYSARAQDASTVFTNPAGMTRLEGNQYLAGGQLLWSNTSFSSHSGTSPQLGTNEGGNIVGSDGWFPGGGAFMSYSVSEDLKLGMAMTGNFGSSINYDDNWVGRYYGQSGLLAGISLLPTAAYRLSDKFSAGASVNFMYGKLSQQVAINNPASSSDGRLELDDQTWGYGANIGLMYEIDPGTRVGLTWTSQVDLDFASRADFSRLEPALEKLLGSRGLLNANLDLGVKVPQTLMGSFYTQIDDTWALLGSLGWQQWSKFGKVEVGIEDTSNPQNLTGNLDFKDTWHYAIGAQMKREQNWTWNFGVAYDSAFQKNNVSPSLPANAGWRFGFGTEQDLEHGSRWGVAGELAYGGTMDVRKTTKLPVALGGRGDLDGSYNSTMTFFVSAYYLSGF